MDNETQLVFFTTNKELNLDLFAHKFFLKIEFQNSIQDWLFLLCNGHKRALRINPEHGVYYRRCVAFVIHIETNPLTRVVL